MTKSTKYTESSHWKNAVDKAREVLSNKGNADYLKNALDKMANATPGFAKLLEQVKVLVRLSQAYRAGDYRHIPLKSMLLITASILYFINPMDVLPDLVPIFGLVDDATLIGFVITSLRKDIEKFREWEIDNIVIDEDQVALDYFEIYD